VGFLRPLPAAEAPAQIRALGGWLDVAEALERARFGVALAWPRTPEPAQAPIAGAVLVGVVGAGRPAQLLGLAAPNRRAAEALVRAAELGAIAHGHDTLSMGRLPVGYRELLSGGRRVPPTPVELGDELPTTALRVLERYHWMTDETARGLHERWARLQLERTLAPDRRQAAAAVKCRLREMGVERLRAAEADHRRAGRDHAAAAGGIAESGMLALLGDHRLPVDARHRLFCGWEEPPILPFAERIEAAGALARCYKERRKEILLGLAHAYFFEPEEYDDPDPPKAARLRTLAVLRRAGGLLRAYWDDRGRRLDNLVAYPVLAILGGELLDREDRVVLYGPWVEVVEYGIDAESFRPPRARWPLQDEVQDLDQVDD
jgi:hypothetical protein